MAQRRHEIAVRRLMVDQEREGLRLVAPGLHPVEAVLRDEVGRIALGDAAPLRRDDVGVIIFALVVEYLPVVEADALRSEEHTSELQSLMRISYAVFCLKKKKKIV